MIEDLVNELILFPVPIRLVLPGELGGHDCMEFGEPSDLWGVNLTPEDISEADFSVIFKGSDID